VKSLAVLGSGQLARMLVEAAKNLKISMRVVSKTAESPCKSVSDDYRVVSDWTSVEVEKALDGIDTVCIESEFLTQSEIEYLNNLNTDFIPRLDLIQLLRNKGDQKKLLKNLGIPTSDFVLSNDFSSFSDMWAFTESHLGLNFVLKKSLGGYDGNGVFFSDLEKWGSQFFASREEFYFEKKINFVNELAVVTAKTDDEFFAFPVVVSEQVEGICKFVYGPADRFLNGEKKKISSIIEKINSAASKFVDSSGIRGVSAMEFFQLEEGSICVNEIAPRVHNSGHYSLLFAGRSQFDLHLLAAAEESFPIGNSEFGLFAMWNLISPGKNHRISEKRVLELQENSPTGWDVYWYDKREARPNRKMGHVNIKIENGVNLDSLRAQLVEWENNFWRNLL